MVKDRWIDTGLLGASGRRVLRLNTRPMGFRSDLTQTIYAEEQDSEQPPEDDTDGE